MDRLLRAGRVRNSTADLLLQHQDEITRVWEARCRAEIPAAARIDRAVLLDSIEVVIENIAVALRKPEGARIEICYDNVCAEHGRTRAGVPGFSLDQVITEYQLLREAIFQVLQKNARLPDPDRELMTRALDLAIHTVSAAFVNVGNAEREEREGFELIRRFQAASRLYATAAIAISVLALFGWVFDWAFFRSFIVGLAEMSPLTALLVLLTAGSLGFLRGDNLSQNRRLAGFALAGVTVLLCVFHVFDRGFADPINSWLLDVLAPARDEVPRVALPTALSLLLINLALVFSDWRHRWGVRTSQWLAVSGGAIGFWALVDYLYNIAEHDYVSSTMMSLPTALASTLLGSGVLFAHAGRGPMATLTSPRSGGYIVRRVIAASIVLPAAIGFVRLGLERSGLITTTMGTAAVVVTCSLTFSALILWSAKALNRMEVQRDRFFEEVQESLQRRNQLTSDVRDMKEERQVREDFVLMLSHDLRGPLSAAKTSAQLGIRYPDKHESHPQLFHRIKNNLIRIDNMIRDLLDANRIRAGQPIPVRIEECEITSVLQEAVEELTIVHGNRFRLETPGPVRGYWACESIFRIVENLCGNAVKYGSPERPIQVGLSATAAEIQIRVHNEGEPIPAEQLGKIFTPFHRTPDAAQGGQLGWGLGLSLVRGLAEAHRGRVDVRSDAAHGTEFTVTLPRDARPISTASTVGGTV